MIFMIMMMIFLIIKVKKNLNIINYIFMKEILGFFYRDIVILLPYILMKHKLIILLMNI